MNSEPAPGARCLLGNAILIHRGFPISSGPAHPNSLGVGYLNRYCHVRYSIADIAFPRSREAQSMSFGVCAAPHGILPRCTPHELPWGLSFLAQRRRFDVKDQRYTIELGVGLDPVNKLTLSFLRTLDEFDGIIELTKAFRFIPFLAGSFPPPRRPTCRCRILDPDILEHRDDCIAATALLALSGVSQALRTSHAVAEKLGNSVQGVQFKRRFSERRLRQKQNSDILQSLCHAAQ